MDIILISIVCFIFGGIAASVSNLIKEYKDATRDQSKCPFCHGLAPTKDIKEYGTCLKCNRMIEDEVVPPYQYPWKQH